jgi:uncharacterized protein (TIGR04551 family)
MLRELRILVPALSVFAFWSASASAQSTEPPAQPPTTPQQPAQQPTQPSEPRAPLMQPAPPAGPAIDTSKDQQDLAAQGQSRPTAAPAAAPTDGSVPARQSEVYSEDWWGHTRPILEIHGYFRTRGELFHNFFLGRHNAPGGDDQNLWAQPIDHTYSDVTGKPHAVILCGDPGPNGALQPCYDKTQATANMRFRVAPELHISDNLRILSQIDMLDNLVLGSTPDAYALKPSGTNPNGYQSAGNGYNGYAPLGGFSTTQGPPTAGVNGYRNSIDVKRVWAEYMTPLGLLRFGRMPSHWGLGMIANSGEHIDADYASNADRIMFISGVKSIDLYFGGAWDFVSTGPTNASPYDVYGGQAYNTANLTNVDQWTLFVARRTNPEIQKLSLSRGDIVVNGGLYSLYRKQLLDVPGSKNPITDVDVTNSATNNGLERRGAYAFIPDLWLQVLWKKLRFEMEVATIQGKIEQTPQNANVTTPQRVDMWGIATQTEFRAVEDKLRLQFGFGWASGDPWVEGLNPGQSGLQPELNGGRGPISTFRFHPAYTVDLIFFRKILSRVEGAYYFRPSVDYDFIRNPNGQKFGGGAAIVWSRASEFVQTPGNKRDLGVELDLSLYFQAKDGSLNDDPNKIGGFYSMLQYGVFFPLGGLSYLPGEQTAALPNWETSSAQTVRLFLGVAY